MMPVPSSTTAFHQALQAKLPKSQREELATARYSSLMKRAKEAQADSNEEAALFFFKAAFDVADSMGKGQQLTGLCKRIASLEKRVEELQRGRIRTDDDFQSHPDCSDLFLHHGLRVPSWIYHNLYWYQKDALRWGWELFLQMEGGILGDDMGLGKTIQTLSLIASLHHSNLIHCVLLVLPNAVIEHWRKECRKWCREMEVFDFLATSTKGKREKNLKLVFEDGGICITTYGMVAGNVEQLTDGGRGVWDYIILDEGHKIKNHNTKQAKGLRKIASRQRLILTGTPISNNLQEMWALFDFCCEGRLLGRIKTFKKSFEDPITKAQMKDARPEVVLRGDALAGELNDIINPFFLRREKKDVFSKQNRELYPETPNEKKEERQEGAKKDDKCRRSDLPREYLTPDNILRKQCVESPIVRRAEAPNRLQCRKNDLVVWVPIAPAQLQIYRAFLESAEVTSVLNETRSPLAAIQILKKICNHPHLLNKEMRTLQGVVDGFDYLSRMMENESADSLTEQSGKLLFLNKLMTQLLEEGHRTLIFSQSRKMLDIIERVLRQKHEMKWLRIDGTVRDTRERQRRIDAFNSSNEYACFLLTTQVGGLGISLTGANRVVIVDPAWNHQDDQAVDRAYRLGQTRDVVVYRLISCGTIEEKIYRKQVFKSGLMKAILDKKSDSVDGGNNNSNGVNNAHNNRGKSVKLGNQTVYFTDEDLRDLFKLGDWRESETQQQLEEMHSANRVSDAYLDDHIEFLSSLGIFGISDHDLLYTEPSNDGKDEMDEEELVEGENCEAQQAVTLARLQLLESATPARMGFVPAIDDDNGAGRRKERKSSNETKLQKIQRTLSHTRHLLSSSNRKMNDEIIIQYNKLLLEARRAEDSGLWEDSLSLYMDAIELKDDDIRLHYKIAQLGVRLHMNAPISFSSSSPSATGALRL